MAAFTPPPLSAIEPDSGGGFQPPPPIPDDHPSVLSNAYEAGKEFLGGIIPRSPKQYLEMLLPPLATIDQLQQSFQQGSPEPLLEATPGIGAAMDIYRAEQTPAGSKERFGAGLRTLADLAMLAGLERPAKPRVNAPIAPEVAQVAEKPPIQTTAETPPQFRYQPPDTRYQPPQGWQPPPPVPDVEAPAQAPAAPPASPEVPPPMSVADQIRNAAAWQKGLVNEAQQIQSQINISQQIGQPVHPDLPRRLQQINQELARGYQPPQPEIPNASTEPSTTGVGVRGQGTGVGEGTPLRQPRPAAQVRQQTRTGNGQRGAQPVPQQTPWWEAGVAEPPAPTTPAATGAVPEPEGSVTLGVANRYFGEKAAAGQMEPVAPGVGRAARALIRKGERDLALGKKDPAKLAAKVVRGGAVTPDEFAVLRAELKNLYRQSLQLEYAYKLNPSPVGLQQFNNAFTRFNEFASKVVQPAKTMGSDLFRAMQEEVEVNIGSGSYTDLRKAFLDEHGRDLKPREVKSFTKAADKIATANMERQQVINEIDAELKRAAPKARAVTSVGQLRSRVAEIMKKNFPCK